ncbi:Hypothetical predicted protein [Cloeon dipterum]|uniref:Endonuclease/exonuclease/phosphatase domain-containing protein n=1 Tax=Cloeon dipterum TaxID=197152 RepID=A0A8S1DXE2_9INSE|nr:Hypothetical predicted protein [Cloeon dipterum]
MSTGEKAKFRLGGYKCMVCALPSISDSLWSLPAAMNFPVLHTTSNRPKKEATILCFNARSLKNRKRAADIAALLDMHSADIVAINETWLSADVLDHEVIPTDYVVLRKDRVGGKRPAGGVLLAILPHLQPRRQIQLETSAEAVWAELTISNVRVLIASVYRAPNSSAEQNEELLRSLSLAAEQQHNYDALFVMGDLNLEIDWNAEAPIPKSTVAENFWTASIVLLLPS